MNSFFQKSKLTALLFLSSSVLFLQGEADALMLQLRAGYFYPASPVMRDLFHHGGAELEAELGVRLFHNLTAWANFNYFHRHGRSFGICDKTTFNMYPISFGLKYIQPVVSCFSIYLGAGASCSFVGLEEKSPFAFHSKQKRNKWGAVAKSGLLFQFTDHLFMDIFADGYYTRANLLGTIHNVGGLRTGVGLGVSF